MKSCLAVLLTVSIELLSIWFSRTIHVAIKFAAMILASTLLLVGGLAHGQSRVENPVVPTAILGPYTHAKYPSLESRGQQWTHLGVDLLAPAGTAVYAFGDGTVDKVITKGDPEHEWAGYAVMIRHAIESEPLYTIYLHLEGPLRVKPGDQVKGGQTQIGSIGKLGESGHAYGTPHVHFEVRRFPDWLSRWGNIYAPGDQSQSSYLKTSWENPIEWFKRFPTGLTKIAAPSEPVTSLRSLAGQWHGVTSSGERFTMTIEGSGRYETVYPHGVKDVRRAGRIWVTPQGSMEWRSETGRTGAMSLIQDASGNPVICGSVAGLPDTFEARQAQRQTTGQLGSSPSSSCGTGSAPGAKAGDIAAPASSTREPGESAFQIEVCDRSYSEVRVDVAEGVDLSNDATARMILERGARFARERCQWIKGLSNIVVFVVQPGNQYAQECLVRSRTKCVVRGRNYEETKLTWQEYWNVAFAARVAHEREKAQKMAEAERGKAIVPVSRTIEGFSLGMTKEQALAHLKQGWGGEYTAYLPDERERLKAPIWFSTVRSGQVGRVKVGERTTLEGVYLRTKTTRYVALYFYRDTLYNIAVEPLGEPEIGSLDRDEVFQTLVRKYGQPATRPGSIALRTAYFWQDAETELAYESIGYARRVAYTDRGLFGQIRSVEEQVQREKQERLGRERKTLPKGY